MAKLISHSKQEWSEIFREEEEEGKRNEQDRISAIEQAVAEKGFPQIDQGFLDRSIALYGMIEPFRCGWVSAKLSAYEYGTLLEGRMKSSEDDALIKIPGIPYKSFLSALQTRSEKAISLMGRSFSIGITPVSDTEANITYKMQE